jgi:hypothetical protein
MNAAAGYSLYKPAESWPRCFGDVRDALDLSQRRATGEGVVKGDNGLMYRCQ